MMTMRSDTTIAAIATPMGQGGVGVIRISGPLAPIIAKQVTDKELTPRHATFATFKSNNHQSLDEGIALLFKGPHSFTGEDVVELQGHGGMAVQQQVLDAVIQAGAVIARPGEFSERAFLNGKMDLIQAEAVADLIAAGSQQAAQAALRSLQGDFSDRITDLCASLTKVRVLLESSLDFSDEEIPLIQSTEVQQLLSNLESNVRETLQIAQQGARLRTGLSVAILGQPNAGKSSLLNALAMKDRAIVTNIAGTTRDALEESILIDGMPLNIIDTAGVRETDDVIEQEGVKRAWQQAQQADLVIWVIDATVEPISPAALQQQSDALKQRLNQQVPILLVLNKIDLCPEIKITQQYEKLSAVALSAKTHTGLSQLKATLLNHAGMHDHTASLFSARTRHVQALQDALEKICNGVLIHEENQGYELIAEELKLAHHRLGEITGEFTTEDLLGEIFSTFCIGK